ncbi:hypothetical protein CR513_24891, partial [Mucuna pruriens]
MDKNNSSSTSVCTKIRRALASNPAVRAVQRISSFNQEPKVTKVPPSSKSITNISIQSKPPPHHESGSGAIPIKFDHHSPPKLSENGNSAILSVASERTTKVVAKGEREAHPQHDAPMQGKKHGHGMHSEAQGKKQMDINDHFKDFIQQTRDKMMRSMSIISLAHNNPAAAAPDHEAHGGDNKNESHFSEFIHLARKKLRTTTTARKNNNYLKKE